MRRCIFLTGNRSLEILKNYIYKILNILVCILSILIFLLALLFQFSGI